MVDSAREETRGTGGFTYGVPGAIALGGKAMSVDGSVQLVLGERFDFASPAAFTIEAWVKLSVVDALLERQRHPRVRRACHLALRVEAHCKAARP